MGLRQRNCPMCGRPFGRTHHCRVSRVQLPPLVRMPADFRDRIHPAPERQPIADLLPLDWAGDE